MGYFDNSKLKKVILGIQQKVRIQLHIGGIRDKIVGYTYIMRYNFKIKQKKKGGNFGNQKRFKIC